MSNNDGVGPGGKGDKPRPINDRKKFEENFDRIFGKKDDKSLTEVVKERQGGEVVKKQKNTGLEG